VALTLLYVVNTTASFAILWREPGPKGREGKIDLSEMGFELAQWGPVASFRYGGDEPAEFRSWPSTYELLKDDFTVPRKPLVCWFLEGALMFLSSPPCPYLGRAEGKTARA
jgi:hypothetical protein